ncbi:alpha mannosidase-like protein [Orbilia brochopaga]|uniref:alpha-1,2-Mannosidase n=1 Tax=Orbilia brochopaga TaxID=3140254 RepID=A0AAV9UDU7_9PEZI
MRLDLTVTVLLGTLLQPCLCMPKSHILNLRSEAHAMFHHGYDSYFKFAFPADEIRPLSCIPLSRDNQPENFALNDVLGNYSVTAVDSLSALAILSHTSAHSHEQFWRTVQNIVDVYYPTGFDRDAKVQVFETVIRGVGGLVSAHEFAVGLLPMAGIPGVGINGWKYENQLLHLAHDLATRLLPAFTTDTGIPYPRVNLKYGCVNVRPEDEDAEANEKCRKDDEEAEKGGFKPLWNERTETCAAGAGSLTLELSTLSRLLQRFKEDYPEEVEKLKKAKDGLRHKWDDVEVFEKVSQDAFWSVWERRSELNLVGAGLDAVTGSWEQQSGSLAGIGASTDSFFEYAMKTYILLSASPTVPSLANPEPSPPLAYFDAFEQAAAAINKHMLVDSPAVFYQGVHMQTGDAMVQWVDSLSAFWPGLLVLAGNVSIAEKACLFYTALWQRHQALPERYIPARQIVALQWWPGRPEFAESVYHLYRATKDVWYLRVGEMILRDIQRRCWGRCGWGGLQDVRSGEVSDRMESFMLSETAAYLYLLFDDDHPLHKGDQAWVFTTEGHPIIMPPQKRIRGKRSAIRNTDMQMHRQGYGRTKAPTCENPKMLKQEPEVGALFSRVASRTDTFHSYNAVGLNLLPPYVPRQPTRITLLDNENTVQEFGYYNDKDEENPYRYLIPYSPTNGSFYPWTLPPEIISPMAYCGKLPNEHKLDLVFSVTQTKPGETPPPGWINIRGGVLINSLSGLRLGFEKQLVEDTIEYFVTKIGDRVISRDEIVVIEKVNIDTLHVDGGIRFQTSKDEGYEVVFDFETEHKPRPTPTPTSTKDSLKDKKFEIKLDGEDLSDEFRTQVEKILRESLLRHLPTENTNTVPERTLTAQPLTPDSNKFLIRRHLHAILSSGIGAVESPPLAGRTHSMLHSMVHVVPSPTLPWRSVYVAGLACDQPLPSIAATYPVILFKRGKCPFSQKMSNVPTSSAVKLAIVVNFDESVPTHAGYEEVVDFDGGGGVNDWVALRDDHLIRPLLDRYQVDSRNGQRRKNPVALVFVGGGEATYRALADARAVGLRERWKVTLDGLLVGNLVPVV